MHSVHHEAHPHVALAGVARARGRCVRPTTGTGTAGSMHNRAQGSSVRLQRRQRTSPVAHVGGGGGVCCPIDETSWHTLHRCACSILSSACSLQLGIVCMRAHTHTHTDVARPRRAHTANCDVHLLLVGGSDDRGCITRRAQRDLQRPRSNAGFGPCNEHGICRGRSEHKFEHVARLHLARGG